MATNLSDIIQNSGDMSSAELGSSLLQRKQEQTEERYKRSKKSNKIDKTLALVMAGQSIFTDAYRTREKELRDAETWEARENVAQARQINNLSYLGKTITPDFLKTNEGLTPQEQAKKLLEDRQTQEIFIERLTPALDTYFEAAYGEEALASKKASGQYRRLVNASIVSVAEDMLTVDENGVTRIQGFIDELPSLFKERDFDRLELLEKGRTLTPLQLTNYEAESFKQMREQYRAQGNIIGGIKGIFRRLSGKAEAEGTINIFKKIEDLDLSNPKLSRILDSIDLKGFASRAAVDAVVETRTDTNYVEEAKSEKNAPIRAQIIDRFKSIGAEIEGSGSNAFGLRADDEVALVGSENLFAIAGDDYGYDLTKDRESDALIVEQDYTDFVTFLEDDDNTAMREKFYTDVTALALKMKNEDGFAAVVYATIEDDPVKIEKFKAAIQTNTNLRTDFAIVYVARKGFKGEGESAETYDYSGYNIAGELGARRIDTDAGTFTVNEVYINSTVAQQQQTFDAKIKDILTTMQQAGESEEVLQRILDALFSQISSPDGKDQTETIKRISNEARGQAGRASALAEEEDS